MRRFCFCLAFAACGGPKPSQAPEPTPTHIELRVGAYSGVSEVLTDTCGVTSPGHTEGVDALWMGNGLSGFECSRANGDLWLCIDYLDHDGACELQGTEAILVEPITDRSFRATHTIDYLSELCGVDCRIEMRSDLVLD